MSTDPSLPRPESLAALLALRGRLPPAQVAWLGMEILGRLHLLHEAGRVAGRLLPRHLLLVRGPGGRPTVQLEGDAAPAEGRLDPRGDVHACGALLYQVLVGRPPFEAAAQGPPPTDGIPDALAMVILQALEADPEDRFESAAEMAAVLAMAWPDAAPISLGPQARQQQEEAMPVQAPAASPSSIERTPGPAAHEAGVARAVLVASFAPDPAAGAHQPAGAAARQPPQAVAREVIESFFGKVRTSSAAQVVASFASPTDCLQAAASIHDRLAILDAIHGPSLQVRAAVAIGEVAGAGRQLQGAPVEEASLLAEVAAPGEVLFTHGAYLAMTRSEVESEPWPGEDPGLGQRVHRLVRPRPVPQAALPFGGAYLGQSRGLSPRRIAADAGRLADGSVRWAARWGRRVLAGAARRRRHLATAAGLVLAAGLGAGAVWATLPVDPADEVEDALARGDVARAEQVADTWRQEAPADVAAQAFHARTLASAGRLEEAHQALGAALAAAPALARDEGVARALVRTLDRKGADRSLILRHRSAAVDRALVEATRSPRNWERWNAVRALDRLGKGDLVDRVEVHLLDLEHGRSCGTRIRAARALGELGDERAVAPLEAARGTRLPGWACNLDDAIDDALAAIAGLPPEDEAPGGEAGIREAELPEEAPRPVEEPQAPRMAPDEMPSPGAERLPDEELLPEEEPVEERFVDEEPLPDEELPPEAELHPGEAAHPGDDRAPPADAPSHEADDLLLYDDEI